MINWLRPLFGRGVARLDPNALVPFEKELLRSIVGQHHHHMGVISLQAQLNRMIDYRRLPYPGWINWLRRKRVGNEFVIRQSEPLIGAEFGAPSRVTKVDYDFPIVRAGERCGLVRIRTGQYVEELRICLHSTADTYPDDGSFQTGLAEVDDQRAYWRNRAEQAGELCLVADAVCEIVGRGVFARDVVVPVPFIAELPAICGIPASESYTHLLRYSNGIRINRLHIYEAEDDPRRVFEEAHHRYVRVGHDHTCWYALQVGIGGMADEVVRWQHHAREPRSTGMNVIDLCLSALKPAS